MPPGQHLCLLKIEKLCTLLPASITQGIIMQSKTAGNIYIMATTRRHCRNRSLYAIKKYAYRMNSGQKCSMFASLW
jgi:hypothetical protein